jgi:hypothetical protein
MFLSLCAQIIAFIIQLFGRSRWELRHPMIINPRAKMKFRDSEVIDKRKPLFEVCCDPQSSHAMSCQCHRLFCCWCSPLDSRTCFMCATLPI